MHSYVIDRRADLLRFVTDFTSQTLYGVSLDWILANFRPTSTVTRQTLVDDLCDLSRQGLIRIEHCTSLNYYWPTQGQSA